MPLSEQPGEITIQELREIARYFHALRDILRLRILLTLAERGEMTVTELAQTLRVSQPLISFHLRPLRLIDLVQVRRVGREVYCSVNLSEIQHRQDEFMQLLASAQV
jgi:ArsR family transcriptional regulator, arsenate/arsenite/antimonite-responsive transcriptional repressor